MFLVKNLETADVRSYRLSARKVLRELIKKDKVGFDVLAATNDFLSNRDDYFYKVDILQNGKVLYVK